jgi:hypothetical protein
MANPQYISIKDGLKMSVEANSGGLCTVLYDDLGLPSIMRVIPKFNTEDIDAGLGSGVFPAFSVDGVEKDEIFIAQYLASIYNSRAYSMPRVDPAASLDYDDAVGYCTAKGTGWHLMTAWEWAAVALMCFKTNSQPRGNTNYGRAHDAYYETAPRYDSLAPGTASGTARTLTGSGPNTWNHDGSPAGIADLVGNVWEWQHGLKLVNGRIYCIEDNDYTLAEGSWTAQSAYFNSPVAGDGSGADNLGVPDLADAVTNYGDPNPSSSGSNDYNHRATWRTMVNNLSSTPDILRQLLIAPTSTITDAAVGAIYVRNYGERLPRRGGSWDGGPYAGLAALALNALRSYARAGIGFRPAYIA